MTKDNSNNKHQQEFLMLYDSSKKQLSCYCKALTGDYASASDLLQESLLIAWEQFERLKKQESFKFFVMTIAKRIYLKSKRNNDFRVNFDSIQVKQVVTEEPSIVSADCSILYKAMSKLPIEQREALVMFEIIGYSLNEIVKMQNVSLSAVKSRVSRGRAKLGELLADTEQPLQTKNSKSLIPQSHE